LINLDDIKKRAAIGLLENYTGINPYIRQLRINFIDNKIPLTANQFNYVTDNHDKEPILINRTISITPYLGAELQKKEGLKFLPEKILFEYILAETDKAYHVYGKLKRNQEKSGMYFLPKTQILDDPYYEKISIDINFDKYNSILAKYGKKIYKYQEEGVEFMLARKGCIMGDQMGSGKTLQSIIAALESGAERILVICPASVKINWEREINVFCKDTAIVDSKNWKQAKFTIINFDILKNFHTLGDGKEELELDPNFHLKRQLVDAKFDLMIVDEAHNLKEKSSIRGAIVSELSHKYGVDRVWLLTGTPVANRPMDFFNLLKIIKSPIADNWMYFTRRYCDGKSFFKTLKNKKKKKIWLTGGASNLDELASKTKNILIRRLKKDILELPEKIVSTVYHKLSDSEMLEYNNLWEEYLVNRREQKKRGQVDRDMVELGILRKYIALKAIPKTIEMVESALEDDRKVIIFTTFTEELEVLYNHFGKICVKHNGPMTDRAKQASVDNFQNDPKIKVFVGNIKSAGVGITLTEGTVTIFNSFSWVPGDNEQGEDRNNRIGQKNEVNVYYQLFMDTVSMRVWNTLKNKKKVINKIIGDDTSDEEVMNIIMDEILNDENG
jgi:SWI/SNF-related matrix-associated actin-dependent regulator 1 of chromatin subfamily A